MFGGEARLKKRSDDESEDSGAETALCDCSRMSSSSSSSSSSSAIELVSRRVRPQRGPQLLLLHLHLLANPGDSLLLQHSLDRLLRWLCPSLRIFHVSERASPFRGYTRLCPVTVSPSVAITFFLHEAYGEQRILKVLDFFQRPPWQYHHTESCGSRAPALHITSSGGSSASALLRPYLLPSRDFYSLGAGMPVWGVRPVHCGGEILRVTLYSGYDNYEDAVRLYELVLQRQAEEQKTGFCWFTLHTEPGLCLQLALKQLSPGVRVEPCSSAVLQFSVDEIGQLVPLLPNPCSPISSTRWQTEDLDGNKVLFQVKTPAQPQRPLTCAFPLTCPSAAPRGGLQFRSHSLSLSGLTGPLSWQTHRQAHRPRSEQSLGSGSSSCYSSQHSSPAPPSSTNQPDSPLHPSITRSLSHLLLEEDEEEPETNVDTGAPVPSGAKMLPPRAPPSERPPAPGVSAVQSLAEELMAQLPRTQGRLNGTWGSGEAGGQRWGSGTGGSTTEVLSTYTDDHQGAADEFFI